MSVGICIQCDGHFERRTTEVWRDYKRRKLCSNECRHVFLGQSRKRATARRDEHGGIRPERDSGLVGIVFMDDPRAIRDMGSACLPPPADMYAARRNAA